MSKFGFVILHYNTTEDTFACVDSIKNNCRNVDYHIYIVDNASPNSSGMILKERFFLDKMVTVILSDSNLGFARGNNLGIEQSKRDGYSDFIIVTNNDTKIIQDNFCVLIEDCFVKSSFAVLGPTIYTPKGETFMNPFGNQILCGKELNSAINYYKISHFLIKTNLASVWRIYSKIRYMKKHFLPKMKRIVKRIPIGHFYTENCILHGCCLVFSKKFFEKLDGFDPRTFLYVEEFILHAHVVKSGMKTVYAPNVKIWHKEDGATDSVFKDSKEKMLFKFENMLKSLGVYQKVLNE